MTARQYLAFVALCVAFGLFLAVFARAGLSGPVL